MLAQSKEVSETLRKVYKASSDFIGDASLSAEQQVALKTRSLCIPLLVDNPWIPPNDEDDTINEIVLEDRGLDAIPNDGSDEKTKFLPQGWQGSKNRMGPVLLTLTAIGA